MADLDEQDRIRQRAHKLADVVQGIEVRVGEQQVVLDMMQRSIETMQSTFVNRDLLNATVGVTLAKIETLHSENAQKFEHVDTKLDHLHSDLMPIRRAIYWAASLVVGAVILALMAMVIQQVQP